MSHSYKKVYPIEVLSGFTVDTMFVLMLYEPIGNRKVPIMIGQHEAEMIQLEQLGRDPQRPMTHQLIISILEKFELTLKRVRIDKFSEGLFYATLEVSDGFNTHEIDARASDAVTLALHQYVDIEMEEQVLNDTSFTPKESGIDLSDTLAEPESLEELEEELRRCEENEDYERAAEIMELIKKRKD